MPIKDYITMINWISHLICVKNGNEGTFKCFFLVTWVWSIILLILNSFSETIHNGKWLVRRNLFKIVLDSFSHALLI